MFICNVEKKTSKRRKNTSERQRTATECMANTNLGPCVCVCFIFIACSFLLKVSRFHCAKCFLFFLVFAGRFPSNAVLSNSNAVLVLIHEHDPLCASRFLHCNSLRRIYVALDSIPLYFSLTLSLYHIYFWNSREQVHSNSTFPTDSEFIYDMKDTNDEENGKKTHCAVMRPLQQSKNAFINYLFFISLWSLCKMLNIPKNHHQTNNSNPYASRYQFE